MKAFDLSSSLKLKTNYFRIIESLYIQNNKKVGWLYKRIALHIIWGILNILGLIYISRLIKEFDLELVFLIGCLVYCSSYWLITSILFDKLIGDEVDACLE